MQAFENNNKDIQPLTPDELREFEGLSHLSDKQAYKVIDTLNKLAEIGINTLQNK